MPTSHPPSAPVLIVAPTGADAQNLRDVLRRAGYPTQACPGVAAAAERVRADCGALLIAEEALRPAERDILAAALSRQPPWSDLPVILITGGRAAHLGRDPRELLGPRGNITLVERPLHVATLVSTVAVALRSRQRQFELHDLLAERDGLLASLEERVRERTAKLQAMVTEMEAFSYSVSHDLRSPLRVLAGYAQALREDHAGQLDAEGQAYLRKIERAAERMDRLTQDLLAYTRVAGGDLPLVPVDLDEVVQNVIETYPALREARAHIRVASPLGWVCGHAPSLVQCFSNLLDNALKFTREGETPHVDIASEPRGDQVRCIVSDRGPGVSPVDQERIFGLFERASGRQIAGTGVGLAIVKKAIERMGGSVGLDSVPGEGARFWFEVPAHHADEKCA